MNLPRTPRSDTETPHQFVLRQRLERAEELLRAPNTRVLDVAIACGFKTQQHFARVFRHVCGASPTEYRQEWSRNPSARELLLKPESLTSPKWLAWREREARTHAAALRGLLSEACR